MIFSDFKKLLDDLGIGDSQAAEMINISVSEFEGFPSDAILSHQEKELAEQVNEINVIGVRAFDADNFRFIEWMHSPIPFFGNICPIELCRTSADREILKQELIRIEYSLFT